MDSQHLPKKPRSFKKGRDDRTGLTALGADPDKARQDQLDLLHQVTNAKDVEGFKYLKNLDLKVGSSGFATWYMISSSFPLIAAAIGPLANMCAIAALAEPWLYYPDHSYPKDNGGTKYDTIKDKPWITALNAISLFLGVVSNLSLLMNFAGRINYSLSQAVSIGGFCIAGCILMTLTMICKYVLLNDELGLTSSYWHAVLTAACYFASSLLLLINEIGHLRGYYGATFNLSKAQRGLMLQNIALVVWLASGAGLFQSLMDLSYPDALYLCQVSLLTIGLGDIHPLRSVSRALMIPFALIGTLMLGLIIASIRSMILTSSSETLTWNYAERNRKKEMINIKNNQSEYNEKDGFDKMREFHDKAESYRTWLHLVGAGFTFAIFLTMGALCFYLVEEDWTYFDGIYFCCLCLLTIGYGDPVPVSTVGRSFFIVWSLAAVPMMTILISSMGDTIIRKVVELSDRVGDWALEFHGFALPSVSTRGSSSSRVNSPRGSGDNRVGVGGSHPEDEVDEEEDDSPSGPHNRAFSMLYLRFTGKKHNDKGSSKEEVGQQQPKPEDDDAYGNSDDTVDDEKAGVDEFPSGDYLLDLSHTIGALSAALQRTFNNEVNRPHYKYSFEEWKSMLKLCSRLGYLRNPKSFAEKKLSPDERAEMVARGDSHGDSDIEEEIASISSIMREDQIEQANDDLKTKGMAPMITPPRRAATDLGAHSGEGAGGDAPGIKFKDPPVKHTGPEIVPHYWLSDLSPLRFPVRENRIFNKKYLNTLEAVSELMTKALEAAEGG